MFEPEAWEAERAGRLAAARRLAEALVLDVLRATGVPEVMVREDRSALLARHEALLDAYAARFDALAETARSVALSHVAAALHAAEGADHEMVDQAIEYAVSGPVVTPRES